MIYDVIISGGGPAGSAAAIQAASEGLRCILLESESFPREQPGETLHPGIEPLLARLGVKPLEFPRMEGIWSAWGGPPRLQPFGEDERGTWLGYHAWRADFDRILLDRARDAGCEVRQPARAIKPLSHPGHILTSDGELKARLVIDASGRRNWLARHLNLAVRYESPKQAAAYSYVQGAAEGPDPLIESDEDGWTWTARVKDDLTGWVRLRWDGEPVADSWRPPNLSHLRDARPVRHADVTWRKIEQPAAAGYFITGDAAAVLDPTSSHGVLRAVMTGMMAGYLAARADQGDVALQYNQWLEAWFDHDLAQLRALRDSVRGQTVRGGIPNSPARATRGGIP